MDHVEAARAESELDRRHVHHDVVALAHLADESDVGPGGAPGALDLDLQRVGGDHDPTAQREHQAAAPATIASQTASIPVRASVPTDSSCVWFSRVPLASRTQS